MKRRAQLVKNVSNGSIEQAQKVPIKEFSFGMAFLLEAVDLFSDMVLNSSCAELETR